MPSQAGPGGPGLPLPPGLHPGMMMGGGTAQFALGATPVRISQNGSQGVRACAS